MKDIIAVLLFKKSFENEDRRNNYLKKNNLKNNFRKKKPIMKNNYIMYKQKDFIKYNRIEERILNNSVKYLIGFSDKKKNHKIKNKK